MTDDRPAYTAQPAPSAAAAVVVYEQKENEMQVWFRPARMHGHPERTPIKATITKDRGNGIVDLTYDDGEFSGNARAVPNALRLPRNVREQVAVWWDVGFEMDFQTAVDNSLKKKKDDPPPQPSPTPQADSQPAPVLDNLALMRVVMRADEALAGRCTRGTTNWAAAIGKAVQDAVLAARAPADSVTAPAAGAIAGPVDDLAELALLNRLIELGSRAACAHATSNSDDGHKGTAAYVEWQELRAEMGELIRTAYAAAPTPPAQAADSVLEDAARLLRQILAASQDGDSDTHLSAHFVSRIETITKAGGAA